MGGEAGTIATTPGASPMKYEGQHSSTQPDPRVRTYYWAGTKYYYLPIYEKTLFPPLVARALGSDNTIDRNRLQMRESIIKAAAGHYSDVKIPVDRIDSDVLDFLRVELKPFNMGLVLQVCSSFLFDDDFFDWVMQQKQVGLEIILDERNEKVDQRLRRLLDSSLDCHLSVVVHRDLNWRERLSEVVLENFRTIHLYFSYQFELTSPFLNCKESHSLVGLLRQRFPQHDFLPPKGVDLWDHRARSDFDMEPLVQPCWQSRSENPQVKYSVVIPTYNNQNHLRVVLKHLYKQNIGLDHFEVIVVDDGGTDQTQPLVLGLLHSLPQPMNFKYVFFQRHRKRVMGDSQYRAGISRNVGVKNSEGEILCFLDSDIVTPPDYLQKVGEALTNYDAVQAKRINLSQAASSLDFWYEAVDEEQDCIPDEPYWEDFIATTTHWERRPYNWKYVCTHSFSLRKDVFWEVGGLKKNYIFYGFEDTDLGYRLVKGGYRLHLLDCRVYHMFHENSRSEFLNLSSLRHTLLSRTAQIFYLHHLDEDIFANLLGFMEPEPTLRRVVRRALNTMSLTFLWRARPPVYSSLRGVRSEVKGGRPC
jgi:glycosyltransferase involved in cell wall biosynthesis